MSIPQRQEPREQELGPDLLRRYYDDGFKLVRLRGDTKQPAHKEWQENDVPLAAVEAWVGDGGAVGLQMGQVSDWISCADLDWPEARALAPHFLPDTLRGAKGREQPSQYFVRSPGLGFAKFTDIVNKSEEIISVKASDNGKGHQVVVAPSVHAKKGPYLFDGGYDRARIVEVDKDEFYRAVSMLAVASLIARYLPERGRHDLSLALAGYMLRNGEPAEAVQKMLVGGWEYHKAPREAIESVKRNVHDTADNLKRGEPVTGGRTLEEMVPGLPRKIAKFLEWDRVEDKSEGSKPPPFDPEDSRGLTAALADAVTKRHHFAKDVGGLLYVYEGGRYIPDGERIIGTEIKRILREFDASVKWSTHRVREVTAYIRTDAPELWSIPPADKINVLNGIIDLESGELLAHTPDFLSPVRIPVEFDASAECPAWDKFVDEVFPADSREIAYEIPGWLMVPDTSIQKAVLLTGEGGNGKSTYLTAVHAFIGEENTTNLSLHKIETDRFAASRLVGKLANICPDLPSDHLTSTSTFKAITGGDWIPAEYKYHGGFDFKPFARLVFSANNPPRSSDASYAFYRRWLVVPFDRTFDPSEQVPREVLDKRLADPKELSGVLNNALAALLRLRKTSEFSESESTDEALADFRITTDPFSVWLDRNTVDDPNATVGQNELRRAYNKFAEDTGKPGMQAQAFGRAITRARPDVQRSQRMYNGVPNERVYVGIGLTSGIGEGQ